MDFNKPRCKYYVWTYELKRIDSDIGDCTNPNVKDNSCTQVTSVEKNCYVPGKGSWGPGNDKKIKKYKEITMLDDLWGQERKDNENT